MKKYFLCYWVWDKYNACWVPNNEIINQHPILWFKNKYPDVGHDNGDWKSDMNNYPTRLGFWSELEDEDVK